MSAWGQDLHQATPRELKAQIEARQRSIPFLLYRDAEDEQQVFELADDRRRVSLGRQPESDLAVTWDEGVSRVHAELERLNEEWTLLDDDRSRNGTWLNGTRVRGRRRLRDGDIIRVGGTSLMFNAPSSRESIRTVTRGDETAAISDAQRRVLVALCRPYGADSFAVPASNQQIADELVLGRETVKTHMRALFEAFGVTDLPQHQKRAQLAALALRSGVVTPNDLAEG